jgi:hypothetical protein
MDLADVISLAKFTLFRQTFTTLHYHGLRRCDRVMTSLWYLLDVTHYLCFVPMVNNLVSPEVNLVVRLFQSGYRNNACKERRG